MSAGAAGSNLVQETLQLIDRGLKEFDRVNTGEMNGRSVILVGETGAGKSTLINLLAGVQLKSVYDDGIAQSRVHADRPLPNFKIGHSTTSETSIPRKVTIESVMYWDCPGLSDNRSIPQEIANAVCIRKIFEVSREVIVLLVTSHKALEHSRALPILNFATAMDQLFLGQVDRIQRSIALVVTSTPGHVEPRHVAELVRRGTQIQTLQNGPKRVILESLLSQPIGLFKAPEPRSYDLDTTDTRRQLLDNVRGMTYARDVVANVTLSAQCSATINESYNELFKIISRLVNDFSTHFRGCIETFVAPYSDQNIGIGASQRAEAARQLEGIVKKLNAVIASDYSVKKIPEMVKACQEIAADCRGTLEDNLQTIRDKVEAMGVLERYMIAGIKLPMDIVRNVREAVAESRVQVEKALINLQAKDEAERAAAEAERAQQEQQRAEQEKVRADTARSEVERLEVENRNLIEEQERYAQQSDSCGGQGRPKEKRNVNIHLECAVS